MVARNSHHKKQKGNLQTLPQDYGEEVVKNKYLFSENVSADGEWKDYKMTNNEITEAYFVARGWERLVTKHKYGCDSIQWISPGRNFFYFLPNILESFPDFKREVLEVMEEEEHSLEIVGYKKGMGVRWKGWEHMKVYSQLVKDLNFLHAAVIAATKYWEEK